MANSLNSAKTAKNDEFYTRLEDIEKEMWNYRDYFKNKVVYCNCDDPIDSNFTKYFILKFRDLGLKKLICTFYDITNKNIAYAFVYEGQDLNGDGIINYDDYEIIKNNNSYRTILSADTGFDFENKEECHKNGIYGAGDFRSKNCILYLNQADIVATNPPFSLFREYVAQLMEYNKKFIIIGNMNAITYKEIFPLIKENKLWLGCSLSGTKCSFVVPEDYEGKNVYYENGIKFGRINNAIWFTNIEHQKRKTPLDLYKKYSEEKYPKYDNYDAIEVNNVKNIPSDYNGVIGVPITFLDKYCPTQFEIVKFRKGNDEKDLSINGYCPYFRILIKKKL